MHRTLLPFVAAALLAAGASAQIPIFDFEGFSASEQAGMSVAGGFDADKDGVDDLLVGHPFADMGGTDAGAIFLISGKTQALLGGITGANKEDRLGWSVAFVGDVNDDGLVDCVAGAPNGLEPVSGQRRGLVTVYLGPNLTKTYTRYGDAAGDQFGHSVSGGIDPNGNGRPDVLVGSPFGAIGNTGYVRGLHGVTGQTFFTQPGPTVGGGFGWSVAACGTVNPGGSIDYVVGCPGDVNNGIPVGSATVYDGQTGVQIFRKFSSQAGSGFGESVGGGFDVNGDGRSEVIVGAPNFTVGGQANAGLVTVYDGASTGVMELFTGNGSSERFGTSVAALGDVDGDGAPDMGCGATWNSGGGQGYLRVVSVARDEELFTVYGDASGDQFGTSVTNGGTFGSSAIPAVVVGSPFHDGPAADTGMARAYRMCGWSVSYCTPGASASGCQAQLTTSGTPDASASSGFSLHAAGAEGAKNGIFFFGWNGRQANSWGNGTSYQCVAPPVKRGGLLPSAGTVGQCDGSFSQDLNALWKSNPNKNPGAGTVVQAQLWYRDPQNTSNQTTSLSNAVEFRVCP